MTRLTTACLTLLLVGGLQASSYAAPIQVDFNTPEFAGPASGTTQSFTKVNALPGVNFTFSALDPSLNPAGTLWWDAGDEYGYRDGFGVMGTGPTSYSGDEIEGDERLMVSFSQALNLRGFNLTDFFHENELQGTLCSDGSPYCYIETGTFWVQYADGTFGPPTGFSAYANAFRTGNGLFSMDLNIDNVIGLVFAAPGRVQGNYPQGFSQLVDFSLAGIKVEMPPVPTPEPTTMVLVGLGLAGVVAKRRRAAAAAR